MSGVRLVAGAADLYPVERELAFGLALRSSALDENLWNEERPSLVRWGL